MELFWIIPLAMLGVFALVIGILAIAVPLMHRALARMGGWQALSARYRAPHEPAGQRFVRQTIYVGPVYYRFATTLVITPVGLYIAVFAVNHPPLFIPWAHITAIRRRSMFWLPGIELTVGSPPVGTIQCYTSLYSHMQPYLTHRAPPA